MLVMVPATAAAQRWPARSAGSYSARDAYAKRCEASASRLSFLLRVPALVQSEVVDERCFPAPNLPPQPDPAPKREHETTLRQPGPDRLTGGDLPDLERRIITPRSQGSAIRAKDKCADPVLMPLEALHHLPITDAPDLNRHRGGEQVDVERLQTPAPAEIGGDCQELIIGTEGTMVRIAAATWEGMYHLPIL